MKKAVVLLSGGMDSCVTARYAQEAGFEVYGLSIRYGQKHEVEVDAAESVAEFLRIPLYRKFLGVSDLLKSALIANSGEELPTNRTFEEMQASGVAPSYVPARNTILLAVAGGYADSLGAEAVFYGAHREDHVGYPDCRPEYFTAMSTALQLGTKHKVRVEAPFIFDTKDKIVKAGYTLGAPLWLTHSCYQGKQPACGVCDTCLIRINAFKKAGFIDPIDYETKINWGGCLPFRSDV